MANQSNCIYFFEIIADADAAETDCTLLVIFLTPIHKAWYI